MSSLTPLFHIAENGTPNQFAPPNTAESEHHFTAKEVAEAWNLSQDTIYRLFVNEPGVLLISRIVVTNSATLCLS